MSISAGALNCWIVIEQPAAAAGAASDAAQELWTRVCGCWAQLTNSGGLEVQMAEQMESRVWWQISIRHRNDLNHTMRARLGTRILNFTAVVNEGQLNIEQRITAWEGKGIE